MKAKQQKYAKNVHVSFPLSRSEFFDVIGLFAKSQTLRVNAKRIQRGERKGKIVTRNFKTKEIFKNIFETVVSTCIQKWDKMRVTL